MPLSKSAYILSPCSRKGRGGQINWLCVRECVCVCVCVGVGINEHVKKSFFLDTSQTLPALNRLYLWYILNFCCGLSRLSKLNRASVLSNSQTLEAERCCVWGSGLLVYRKRRQLREKYSRGQRNWSLGSHGEHQEVISNAVNEASRCRRWEGVSLRNFTWKNLSFIKKIDANTIFPTVLF